MDPGFFSRPPGLWLATLGVAALLLGLGYEAAQQRLAPLLEQARRELAEQTTRANRLAQAQGRLQTSRPLSRNDDEQPEAQGIRNRVLHRGEAAVLMGGRLVIHLESLLSGPKRAEVRFRVVGGQEGTRIMTPGQEIDLTVNGQPLRLSLRRILTSSVIVSLNPPDE